MFCQPPFWFKYEFCSMGTHWSHELAASAVSVFLSLLFPWYPTAAATQRVACLALFRLPQPTIKNSQSPSFLFLTILSNQINVTPDASRQAWTIISLKMLLISSLFGLLLAASSSSIGFQLKWMYECWALLSVVWEGLQQGISALCDITKQRP